jgi:hypothetical protein
MHKMTKMITGISMQEVLEAEELLTDAMLDAGLSGNVPVTIPAAFLFCLGKRIGVNDERRRRKEAQGHD